MSFKKKINGKWYNGNGELIRNPKAYAFKMYGRPYKNNWGTNTVVVNNIYINGKLKSESAESRNDFIENFNDIDDDLAF